MLAARLDPSNRRSLGQSDAYVTVCPNVRVHRQTGKVLIYGFVVSKDVLIEGNYPKVNSSALTLTKKVLEGELKAPKFRQFSFDKLESVKVKGEEIVITLSLIL